MARHYPPRFTDRQGNVKALKANLGSHSQRLDTLAANPDASF